MFAFDLLILPDPVATTPRHLGVNMLTQEHHDQINVWDWLAHSGATMVREFHPEKPLVRAERPTARWESIEFREDFETYRNGVLEDPGPDGPINWEVYSFDTPVRWIGVPDGIIEQLAALNIEPLVSLGYNPKMFPRPLVSDMEFDGIPSDVQIDWGAAASAYDYYFAMAYHYAKGYGSRYFLMHNEPECRTEVFHFQEDIEARLQSGEHPHRTGRDEDSRRTIACLTTQWGVLARMARLALDDAAGLLPEMPRLILSGPTCGQWEPFWLKAKEYLDCLDIHHYHPNPDAFDHVCKRVHFRARETGASFSCSEFNLLPGGLPFERIPFGLSASLDFGRLLMRSLRLSTTGQPPCEFLTMYEFNFPATDNNHKHLVYGDMNSLDWSCNDQNLPRRGDAWYPTASDLQVRFATPAFFLFRMLARLVPGTRADVESFPVLDSSMMCLIDDAHGGALGDLEVLTVDAGERLFVTFLNTWGADLTFPVDLQHCGERFATAVLRETSRYRRDEVVAQLELADSPIMVTLPPLSMTQMILVPQELGKAVSLQLEEVTTTPGSAGNLGLLQTTRLKALAAVGDVVVDVTDLNTVWTSSEPTSVPVHQGGLVQHLRRTEVPVTIAVRLFDGAANAAVTVHPVA